MNALTPFQQLIEVEFTELDALLIKENPEIMNSTTLRIYNPNWIIYPPGNRMPDTAFFYEIPRAVQKFKKLEALLVTGVFLRA
jgi:hypothetical protein